MGYKVNLVYMAFKNLGRHRVKTTVTIIAVFISVWLYIFMDAWLLGMENESKINLVNYETGEAKIYKKEYYDKKDEIPMHEGFYNYKEIIKSLDENGYVASPHFKFGGSLLSSSIELPFLFLGVDAEAEKELFLIDKYIEKGRFIENGKFEIMIGARGAKDLNVAVGDDVRLLTVIDKKDDNGKIKHIHQLIDLKIVGIINSPNPVTNLKIGYLPLDVLQDDRGLLLEGMITEICISKKNRRLDYLPDKFSVVNDIAKVVPGVKRITNGEVKSDDIVVVSWFDDAKDLIAITRTKSTGSKTMIVFLFFLSFIGIANTMLMSVLERTKEIGMIRAIGMKDSELKRLIIYEAVFIGLIGASLGIVLGLITNLYMVNVGIDFSFMTEEMDMESYGYRVIGNFKAGWNFTTIVACGIIAPLISALVSIAPINRALKISISDAMRFE
ncbi:MAG: ABC transporter permease [Spirochaetes bacterium]|nr:ABC transporter permease [Spirochaetota bacterium]